jgi:hypothetical protein
MYKNKQHWQNLSFDDLISHNEGAQNALEKTVIHCKQWHYMKLGS